MSLLDNAKLMSNDKIQCNVCNAEMHCITSSHLKKHNMTLNDYLTLYPNSPTRSESSKSRKSDSAKRANAPRRGVPRSGTVIEKIKKSKKANPKPAWNKGISLTEQQKQQLSEQRKLYYQRSDIQHWNTGNKTSDDTKKKISNTLLKKHEPARISQQLQHKQETANISNKLKELVAKLPHTLTLPSTNNSIRLVQSILEKKARIEQLNCTMVHVDCGDKKERDYTISCNACNHQWKITGQYFTNCKYDAIKDSMCPKCHPRNYTTSKGEQQLYEYITSLGFGAISDRIVLDGLEIDCLVKGKGIGFEYDGLYWHSDRYINKNKHTFKTDICAQRDIRLVHVFEDEWVHKREICESRIAAILGVYKQTFHGRELTISRIDAKVKNDFLNTTHIQGADISSVNIGAFRGDDLLSVMTFKPTNMSKGGDGEMMELSRFSCALHTKIHGIASKLFKYYIKSNPTITEVVSYSDRRWNTGAVYRRLNFELVGSTPIGYWYFDPNELTRLHRSNFMKHKLLDKGLPPALWNEQYTEKEMMNAWGKYLRVWDCGHDKYIFSVKNNSAY